MARRSMPAEMDAAEYRLWTLKQMPERDWQAWIVREARQHGWNTYHTHDSRRSDPGFPDLVCVHLKHGVVYLEVKTERGSLSRDQRRWLATLQAVGERAYRVKPRDVEPLERVLLGEDIWIGPRFSLKG